MSLTNQPDPEVRQRIVQRDLSNVMHPLVHHRAPERSHTRPRNS